MRVSLLILLIVPILFVFGCDKSTSSQAPAPQTTQGYADGDIIFIKSQSSQSGALREATGSPWTHVGMLISNDGEWSVIEAIGPVVKTPIEDYIRRSKNKSFKVYRFRHFDAATMRDAMIKSAQKYNKPYDVYFEFSNDRIYCSELTYKVMLEVTGHELGRIEKIGDMKLDGPKVKALVKKRLTEINKELNNDEDIITPVNQMLDPDLTLIYDSGLE